MSKRRQGVYTAGQLHAVHGDAGEEHTHKEGGNAFWDLRPPEKGGGGIGSAH